MKWENKVVVITGASSGIGAGLAIHCAARGMKVVAAATNLQKLKALEQNVRAKGGEIQIVQLDVADPVAVEALADRVYDRFGSVSILFNNAGILLDGKSWERSYGDWERSYQVNVLGVVNGIRSFVPRMLAQKAPGRIVNTASAGGLMSAVSYMGVYQSTKAAVIAISEALFHELALEEAPVSVSVLCPGDVVSEILDRFEDDAGTKTQSEEERAVHARVADMIARGMSTSEYADRVMRAIEEDKFWVITHDDFKPMLQLRAQCVLSETNPPTMEEVMQHLG